MEVPEPQGKEGIGELTQYLGEYAQAGRSFVDIVAAGQGEPTCTYLLLLVRTIHLTYRPTPDADSSTAQDVFEESRPSTS